jgi:hypothetical protein
MDEPRFSPLSYAAIAATFEMKKTEARAHLGVTLVAIDRALASHGFFRRWPQRERASLRALVASLEARAAAGERSVFGVSPLEEAGRLRALLDSMLTDPSAQPSDGDRALRVRVLDADGYRLARAAGAGTGSGARVSPGRARVAAAAEEQSEGVRAPIGGPRRRAPPRAAAAGAAAATAAAVAAQRDGEDDEPPPKRARVPSRKQPRGPAAVAPPCLRPPPAVPGAATAAMAVAAAAAAAAGAVSAAAAVEEEEADLEPSDTP